MTAPETQSEPVPDLSIKDNRREMSRLIAEFAVKILSQRKELSTLNAVISRRKKAYRETHNRLDQVTAMHNPVVTDVGLKVCAECLKDWPCDTYVIVRPSVIG